MTKIFYSSHYGATQQYAKWLSEELNCSCVEIKKSAGDCFSDCDILIYGGGLYAGNINGIKRFKKNLSAVKDKQVIVFIVGLASNNNPVIQEYINKAFTQEEQKSIKFFYLRGCMEENKLNAIHRIMIKMLRTILKKKPESELTEDDKDITASRPVNHVSKESLTPIIEYISEQKEKI